MRITNIPINLLGLSTKTISNSLSNLIKLMEYLGRKRIVRLCKNITEDEFTKALKNVKEDIEKKYYHNINTTNVIFSDGNCFVK